MAIWYGEIHSVITWASLRNMQAKATLSRTATLLSYWNRNKEKNYDFLTKPSIPTHFSFLTSSRFRLLCADVKHKYLFIIKIKQKVNKWVAEINSWESCLKLWNISLSKIFLRNAVKIWPRIQQNLQKRVITAKTVHRTKSNNLVFSQKVFMIWF